MAKLFIFGSRLNIRQNYSNPPLHAARLVEKILNNPALYEEWTKEVKMVAQRIIDMRSALKNELVAIGTPGNWDHITNQIGMFSFTGISSILTRWSLIGRFEWEQRNNARF